VSVDFEQLALLNAALTTVSKGFTLTHVQQKTLLPITGAYFVTGVKPPIYVTLEAPPPYIPAGCYDYDLTATVKIPADAIIILDKVQALMKTALQLASAAAILSVEQLETIDQALEQPAFRLAVKDAIREILLADPAMTQQLDLAKRLQAQAVAELL